MTTPTNVAPDDARHDYIARVYKMTHAELFNELMRVHTEANKLVEQAVKEEREACAVACESAQAAYTETTWNDACETCAGKIRERGAA